MDNKVIVKVIEYSAAAIGVLGSIAPLFTGRVDEMKINAIVDEKIKALAKNK